MITTSNILSYLIFFPVISAIFLQIVAKGRESNFIAKIIALVTSIATFILSLKMWWMYNPQDTAFQMQENYQWLGFANYSLGIDGISIFFVLLTTFLIPICIIISWNSVKVRVKEYMTLFLLLESMVIGSFCATDIILFYVFFEAVLIPMYLIIGIWGGPNRIYASYKFFLYTFFGSVMMLFAICYIYVATHTTSFEMLNTMLPTFSPEVQKWLWLAFFLSFAVKVPMWPLHTWLPDAHVQAPTAGSVILAGVLLKLGGYGFLRISLPMLPDASIYYADFVMVLSIIAVVYTSMVALMQEDMKKLIAYSSVAHMGFVTAGIFALNHYGVEGAVFQMISHGLVSAALFICVGVLYDRAHTKEINFFGGLTEKMPKYAVLFMLFMLASVGLPATSGFVGEFMVIMGVFAYSKPFAVLMSLSLVLGAAYMLFLYARVMFGECSNSKLKDIQDIDIKEQISLIAIAILVIVLGVYPYLITSNTANAVEKSIYKTFN